MTDDPIDSPYDAPAAPQTPTGPSETDALADAAPLTSDRVNELTVVADAPRVTLTAVLENETPPKYKRTSEEQKLIVLSAVEAGKSAREASTEAGCSIATTFRILAQSENHLEETREAFRKLLQMQALQRLEDWRTASEVGSRKKGNHVPAKDWLLHAGVIDKLDSDDAGVHVAIIIGTDEKPMRIPSPLSRNNTPDPDEPAP
jgi:hypothetical protein